MDIKIFNNNKHVRADGWLSELFTKKAFKDFDCIHSYIVSINPKQARAKHYHKEKTEIIAPVYGKVEIILEDIYTKKRKNIVLSADDDQIKLIQIPPKIAHIVKNPTDNICRIVVFSNSNDLKDTFSYDFGD